MVGNQPIGAQEMSDNLSADDQWRQNRDEAFSCALVRSPPTPLFLGSAREKRHLGGNSYLYTKLTSPLKKIEFKDNKVGLKLFSRKRMYVFFPPSYQTIVSLCLFGNKNKTSWTALSATAQTCILLCHH